LLFGGYLCSPKDNRIEKITPARPPGEPWAA